MTLRPSATYSLGTVDGTGGGQDLRGTRAGIDETHGHVGWQRTTNTFDATLGRKGMDCQSDELGECGNNRVGGGFSGVALGKTLTGLFMMG